MLKLKGNALSISDMVRIRNEVMKYRIHLIRKCDLFVKNLADKGIIVAQDSVGDAYGQYITFNREITEHGQYGCRGVMYGTNTGIIKSQWMTKDGVKEADVSPLLMAEFGSGLRAQRSSNAYASKFGMGTGTFPGQTHAFDPEGWWYMDLAGEWHHSYGVYASMPMYHALVEMEDQLINVALEVFGT